MNSETNRKISDLKVGVRMSQFATIWARSEGNFSPEENVANRGGFFGRDLSAVGCLFSDTESVVSVRDGGEASELGGCKSSSWLGFGPR